MRARTQQWASRHGSASSEAATAPVPPTRGYCHDTSFANPSDTPRTPAQALIVYHAAPPTSPLRLSVALLSQVSPPSSDPSTRHLLLDKFEVKSLNFVLIDLSPAARPLGQRHFLAPDRLHQLPATPTSSLATAIPSTCSPQCQCRLYQPKTSGTIVPGDASPFLHP